MNNNLWPSGRDVRDNAIRSLRDNLVKNGEPLTFANAADLCRQHFVADFDLLEGEWTGALNEFLDQPETTAEHQPDDKTIRTVRAEISELGLSLQELRHRSVDADRHLRQCRQAASRAIVNWTHGAVVPPTHGDLVREAAAQDLARKIRIAHGQEAPPRRSEVGPSVIDKWAAYSRDKSGAGFARSRAQGEGFRRGASTVRGAYRPEFDQRRKPNGVA